MKALITGASGMLGQDLCPVFEDFGYELFETNSKTLDITNKKDVFDFVYDKKPDVIVHLAAYTNVDGAQDEYEKAKLVNGYGTENLAIIASKVDIPILYVSTDYVFDGEKKSPYLVDDVPNPKTVYGKTKLMGEIAIRKNCKKFYIARTSWLYGSYGKNFVDTMINLSKKNDVIKVVNDQIGTPTWTCDLADGIIKVLVNEKYPYGIYHLSGGGKPVSWFEFAKTIFEYSNIDVNVLPCTSFEFKSKADRPKYSYMENYGLLRNWKIALKKYLELKFED